MKKIERGGYQFTSASLFKCLLMLKMVVLLICFFSIQSMANNGFGQDKITLNLENVPLKKVFKAIEKQTSFRFVYSDDAVPVNQKISISVEAEMVNEVMKKLLNK